MEEELKKLYYNICELNQSLYNIKQFHKKFNIHELDFHFKNISEEFLAIHKRLERTHSSTLMSYLDFVYEKAEEMIKYRDINKEEEEWFKSLKEEITHTKWICMYY